MSKSTKSAAIVRTPKGVKDPVKPTRDGVLAAAGKVLAEFGGVDAASDEFARASESLKVSEASLRAWSLVAVDAKAAGVGVVEFGDISGGNRNSRQRLTQLDAILRAAAAKRLAVPFDRAWTDAQKSGTAAGNVVARIVKGENPYAAPKAVRGGAAGTRGKSKSKASKSGSHDVDTKAPVNPVDWSAVLRFMSSNLSKTNDAAILADIAKAATVLAVAANRAAGTPVVVGKAPAAKAAKAAKVA